MHFKPQYVEKKKELGKLLRKQSMNHMYENCQYILSLHLKEEEDSFRDRRDLSSDGEHDCTVVTV